MNINYFMNQANKEAKKAILLDEVPIGAILVDNKDNKIIASAHNETVNKNNPIKHAELIVIEKALVNIKKKFLDSTTLFVTLEPCAMCATAISIVRISKVYFGAYDEKKGSLESIMKIYNTKNLFVPEFYGGINEHESSKLIKDFFKSKRKKEIIKND